MAQAAHTMLRAALGELGDRSFFLAMLFSAWCPWAGVRQGKDLPLQLGLVWAGTSAALLVRSALLLSGRDSAPASDVTVKDFTWFVLLVLAAKAKADLTKDEQRRALAGMKNPFATSQPAPVPEEYTEAGGLGVAATVQWNTEAFRGRGPGLQSSSGDAGYGTMGSSSGSTSRKQGIVRALSMALAFFVPFAVIYLAEADDRSEAVVREAFRTARGVDGGIPGAAVGAASGLLITSLSAVVLGHIMERQVSDRGVLMLVVAAFSALGLSSLGQSALRACSSPVEPRAVADTSASATAAAGGSAQLHPSLMGYQRLHG